MGLQPFYGEGSHPLLWTFSRAARGRITVSGIPKCLNYCEIFIVCMQVTNVAADLADHGLKTHALRDEAAYLNDVRGLERKP